MMNYGSNAGRYSNLVEILVVKRRDCK